jgi:hypothetical protein
MRREPAAVLVWMALWLVVLSITAIAAALGGPVTTSAGAASRRVSDIARSFGPFATLFITLFLLVWAATTVAVFRAVLRPRERGFFFLRLGADELRLGVMMVAGFLLVLAFGGAPAYLLYILLNPVIRAIPDSARSVSTIGALLTVWLDIWLGVRLSLIAVETFAERRFHLTAYWPLTRGRFWYLLSCYLVFFLLFFCLSGLLFGLGGLIVNTATQTLGAATLLRRAGVLVLAGALAVLTVVVWVTASTLFSACQAYAFRAIVGPGKAGVQPT